MSCPRDVLVERQQQTVRSRSLTLAELALSPILLRNCSKLGQRGFAGGHKPSPESAAFNSGHSMRSNFAVVSGPRRQTRSEGSAVALASGLLQSRANPVAVELCECIVHYPVHCYPAKYLGFAFTRTPDARPAVAFGPYRTVCDARYETLPRFMGASSQCRHARQCRVRNCYVGPIFSAIVFIGDSDEMGSY
jgi:hypothetical protein